MNLKTKNGSGLSLYFDRSDIGYLSGSISLLMSKDGFFNLSIMVLGISFDLGAYWGDWSIKE